MARSADITGLLVAWSNGEQAVASPLMDAVYGELRRLARGYLRRERIGPLAATHGLVQRRISSWSISAREVAEPRPVLRDRSARDAPHPGRSRARARSARSGARARKWPGRHRRGDESIRREHARSGRGARGSRSSSTPSEPPGRTAVFGGLTVNETAVVLGVAPITVKRDWALARAWLFRALRAKTS